MERAEEVTDGLLSFVGSLLTGQRDAGWTDSNNRPPSTDRPTDFEGKTQSNQKEIKHLMQSDLFIEIFLIPYFQCSTFIPDLTRFHDPVCGCGRLHTAAADGRASPAGCFSLAALHFSLSAFSMAHLLPVALCSSLPAV